jgi:hypothetical protein
MLNLISASQGHFQVEVEVQLSIFHEAGTDVVILKIFSPKNLAKIFALFA